MRRALRKVVLVILSVFCVGVLDLQVIPAAQASSYKAKEALETVGISTGIGAVIGLSTIAFYDSPTSHLKNVLMGAGAGLILGLGVAAYMVATSPESEEIDPEELLIPAKKLDPLRKNEKEPVKGGAQFVPRRTLNPSQSFWAFLKPHPLRMLTSLRISPLQSSASFERGSFSMQVLELRF